ncbi:MAG: CopG family transcriptional regulator [Firmicutes bacterium]|nr:CopG family transcriptional regulator [Bacillota bacterium]
MTQNKRIMISVPNKLLKEVDRVVKEENGDRSQIISEAVKVYILERKRLNLREKLKDGYQIMAAINLKLAEEGTDEQLLAQYESQLAEAE